MNATQTTRSEARIRQAAHLIEGTAPIEEKRSSRVRKHAMETAWASLSLHAHKLGLEVPRLSIMYDPQQYLEHTRNIIAQLESVRT